eukprot:gene15855-18841_t
MFLGNIGHKLFYLILVVYLFGDLAIYATTVPTSLVKVTGPFSIGSWHLSHQEAYYFFLGLFGMFVVPFSMFNFQKTKYLQLLTLVTRNLAFFLMIILAIIFIAQGKGANLHDLVLFDIGQLPKMFGVSIYAFMCHHSLPSIITPIENKKRLSFIMGADFLFIFFAYSVLCITAVIAFGTQTNSTCEISNVHTFIPCTIQSLYIYNFSSYMEMQRLGMPFYGFRNEQAAGYAASIIGYLTRRPALCITVSGPGLVHALSGCMNAQANCWPLVMMASATSQNDVERGGFQETPQMEAARLYCKKTYVCNSIASFPATLAAAVKESIGGRPGAVYIEMPANVMQSRVETAPSFKFPKIDFNSASMGVANRSSIQAALALLLSASRPVVVAGKGAAYSRCEDELSTFLETTGIPFLTSPMGKGLIADDDERVVSSARSIALKKADVVLVLGARLNWMFGFGGPSTFAENVKFIIVDVSAEQATMNVQAAVTLVGDARETLAEFNQVIKAQSLAKPEISEWWTELKTKIASNAKLLLTQLNEPQVPGDYLTYHQSFNVIRNYMPRDTILINEGANTMDIGRLCLPQYLPRCRLDSGTLATMGVGVGYAIAACGAFPGRPIVCVQGDSAFGFSGMEIEVACRFCMPIIFIIINNNGIYEGLEALPEVSECTPTALPPTSLSPKTHYEKIIEAFGGRGHCVSTIESLDSICKDVFGQLQNGGLPMPVLLNIFIKPSGTIPKILTAAGAH